MLYSWICSSNIWGTKDQWVEAWGPRISAEGWGSRNTNTHLRMRSYKNILETTISYISVDYESWRELELEEDGF